MLSYFDKQKQSYSIETYSFVCLLSVHSFNYKLEITKIHNLKIEINNLGIIQILCRFQVINAYPSILYVKSLVCMNLCIYTSYYCSIGRLGKGS